jgi:hypothetical protein
MDTLIGYLRQQVGKRYQAGPNRFGPDYFDCSGLVVAAYRQIGVNTANVSYTQYMQGQTISDFSHLQPGDLIFSNPGKNGAGPDQPGHVQIYVGGGMVIQAAGTKTGVIKSPLNTGNIMSVKRLLSSDGRVIKGDGSVPNHSAGMGEVDWNEVKDQELPDTGQFGSDLPGTGVGSGAGGGGGGTGAMGPGGIQTTAPATEAEINKYIKDNYGYLVAYLNDPELGPLLRDAAKNQLSKDLLYGKLSQTQWWKTTSDVSRLWQKTKMEDPATAANRLAAQRAKITNTLGKTGVYIDASKLGTLTEDSLKFGWSDDQLMDAVLAYATPGAGGYTQGDLGAYQQQVQSVASAYMLPLDPAQAADMAKRIASGELDMDGVKALNQAKAKSLFANNPDMQKLIDQGVVPKDYFSQHVSTMAQLLEVSPDSIDLVNNPQYRQILDTVDPNTGKHRTMSLTEAEQVARNQSAYKNTNGARRSFLSAAAQLKQTMGIAD